MLAIRCQFLLGTYQAAAPGQTGHPEWPPHPARLHSALVAAGWALGGGSFPNRARAALEWLENAPPPALSVPAQIGLRGSPDVYVPRNVTPRERSDVEGKMRRGEDPSRQIGRVSRRFPTSIPGDHPVFFVWETDPGEHASALAQLAQEVAYLGSSRSPVCCASVNEPPAPTLVPVTTNGTLALRVPADGFTDSLIANRYACPPPATGGLVPYRAASDPEPTVENGSGPFGDLVILRLARGFPLTLLHAQLVAKALRSAVLAQAGDDAPAVLHGHGRNPHAAFLPLANVGHPASTGQILGVAVALPRDATEEERGAIVRATTAVKSLRVHRSLEPWALSPNAGTGTLKTLAPRRWVGPSRHWRTVTPVILDRFPKRGQEHSDHDALREAALISVEHALLPRPRKLSVSRVAWTPGAIQAQAYEGDPPGLRLHIDLHFEEPLRGPVLVGRGRYMGLGLFEPVADTTRADAQHD